MQQKTIDDCTGVKRCPKCGAPTLIYDCRPDKENRIVRYRRCRDDRCGYKFKTIEIQTSHFKMLTQPMR